MKSNSSVLAFLVLLLPLFLSAPDIWFARGPVAYVAKGDYIAEIFPAKSHITSSKKPMCFLYRQRSYDSTNVGHDPRLRFQLIWKGELPNRTAPNEAIVSNRGHLILLDEHAFLGAENSVVIYSPTGKLSSNYHLKDLLPSADIENITRSTSSIWWRSKARYFFANPVTKKWFEPTHLYIALSWNKALEFDLSDGSFRYDRIEAFEYLTYMLQQRFVNEEDLVREIDLHYSSITELLRCYETKQ